MIDDRRKPSVPPPPPDANVQTLAGDGAPNTGRRKATRKLRVPNDPVPRQARASVESSTAGDAAPPVEELPPAERYASEEPDFDDSARTAPVVPIAAAVGSDAAQSTLTTDPDIPAFIADDRAARPGRFSSRPPPPAPGGAPPSEPFPMPQRLSSLLPRPRTVPPTRLSSRPPPPAPGSIPPPAPPGALAPPRVPSIAPGAPKVPSIAPEALAKTPSILPDPPKKVPSIIPEAAPPDGAHIPRRAPSFPPPEAARISVRPSVPPPAGDGEGVVRQVRRKVRSVGTGVAPTPSRIPPPDPAANVMAAMASLSQPPIPMAAGARDGSHLPDDDFAIPADDSRGGSMALRAPSLPSDFGAGTPESIIVSMDDDSPADEAADLSAVADEVVGGDDEPPARAQGPTDASGPPQRLSSPKMAAVPPPPPSKQSAKEPAPSAEAKPEAPPSPPAAKPAKKKRPWWEELFNDDYFRAVPKWTREQAKTEGDFIEASLGAEKGAAILDVACGAGRQAIELALRGYEVIALDLSLAMLSRAADEAQDREAKLNFLHSDMREMEFNGIFDAAYSVNSSFGFFDDEKNADVVRRIHKALKVGGTLLLDVLNRDYVIQYQPDMIWFEGDGCVCMEETYFNFFTSRLNVKRTMIMDDGRQKEIEYSLRLYSLHELGQVLHKAGFSVVEVSGHPGLPGAFFGDTSERLIILAQKRAPEPAAASTTPPTEALPPTSNG